MGEPSSSREPSIAELFGLKRERKKGVGSSEKNKPEGATEKKNKPEGAPEKKTTTATIVPENAANDETDARVRVSLFDYSVKNFFRAMDTTNELCGEAAEADDIKPSDMQRLSSSITFLKEWRDFNYEPRSIKFACESRSFEGKDVVGGIELPQYSSATVPNEGKNSAITSLGSRDFVLYAGGSVWALDWCPRIHENSASPFKCEFIAVAAHPPGASYHKIGYPTSGRGIIQIWCLLTHENNEEASYHAQKREQRSKRNRVTKEKSTEIKRPRGRPRKKPIETPCEVLNSNQNVQPHAVEFPENSSELLALDRLLWNSEEHTVPEDSCKKQQRDKKVLSDCKSMPETSFQKPPANATNGMYGDDTSPLLFTQCENYTNNQMCDDTKQDTPIGTHSIPEEFALPRVVSCLAHNGKVAWDVKWRPSNGHGSPCKHCMGYLAVVLGNGYLEVWEVPLPHALKAIYSHAYGTDPRFLKLEPIFRSSELKCGGVQSIPLTVEWSVLPPHDYLLAGYHDGTVALWKFSTNASLKDARPLVCFVADTAPIRAVVWAPPESSPDSSHIILTVGHEGFKFWDLRDPFRPLWALHPAVRIIYSVDWLSNPSCIIMTFEDGTMRTFSLVNFAYDVPICGKTNDATKQGVHTFNCSSFAIWSIQVSRITGMAAYCNADGRVVRFQLTTKAVEKDGLRNRTPHFLCGSFTEEDSTLYVNTPALNSPLPLKKHLSKGPGAPNALHDILLESEKEKRVNEQMEKASNDGQILAVCNSDSQSTNEEVAASIKGKRVPKFSSSDKDNLALVCTDDNSTGAEKKDIERVQPESGRDVFPPKSVAIHRVRWNMNKGCQRWLCYGGAAGIVRCQEIVYSEVDWKLALNR